MPSPFKTTRFRAAKTVHFENRVMKQLPGCGLLGFQVNIFLLNTLALLDGRASVLVFVAELIHCDRECGCVACALSG